MSHGPCVHLLMRCSVVPASTARCTHGFTWCTVWAPQELVMTPAFTTLGHHSDWVSPRQLRVGGSDLQLHTHAGHGLVDWRPALLVVHPCRHGACSS
jgi:hypothetical protein